MSDVSHRNISLTMKPFSYRPSERESVINNVMNLWEQIRALQNQRDAKEGKGKKAPNESYSTVISNVMNLWEQMRALQSSTDAKEGKVKKTSSDSYSSETVNEIQCQLLEKQQKLISTLMHRQRHPHRRSVTKQADNIQPEISSDTACYSDLLDTVPFKLEKETQTSKTNLIASAEQVEPAPEVPDVGVAESGKPGERSEHAGPAQTFEEAEKAETDVERRQPVPLFKSSLTLSNPHYHFNYADVPFLVGLAPTANHSVIANLQSLIATMKRHTKALCPQPDCIQRRQSGRHSHRLPPSLELQGMKRALKHLTGAMSQLAKRQEMLRQSFEDAKQLDPKDERYQQYKAVSKSMVSAAEELAQLHNFITQLDTNPFSKQAQPHQRSKTALPLEATTLPTKVVRSADTDFQPSTSLKLMQAINHTKKALKCGDFYFW